jgi:hypothetical protein
MTADEHRFTLERGNMDSVTSNPLFRVLVGAAFLLMAQVGISGDLSAAELFRDTAFAEGFGPARNFGVFDGSGNPPQLIGYRDISPFQVYLIPEGPVCPGDARTHPWEFEEGFHVDFVDESGKRVAELFEHRLAVNHTIETNTADCLQFSQFNNYGLSSADPQRNQRLAKRVWTDRRGTIRLYQDSSNEIRNVATGYGPPFARDTWPHLLLVQSFSGRPKLSAFDRLDFSLNYRVLRQRVLSDWPQQVPGGTPPDMNLQCFFLLGDLKHPGRMLWVGILLQASDAKTYFVHTAVEQWGTVFHREPVTLYGTPPGLDEPRTVRRELKSLVRDALTAAAKKFPDKNLSAEVDDYRLDLFNIGWEGIGHWESECELSQMSLLGHPDQQSPSSNVVTPP